MRNWAWAALLVLAACPSVPPAVDPCAGVACGSGRCVIDASKAACLCDTGFHADGLACVATDVCLPNPCTQPNQTTCSAVGTTAVCACNAGHFPADAGCSPDPGFDCAEQHAGDAFEPDECPSIATAIEASDVPLSGHTIEPAGDADWYRFTTTKNHVYSATAMGAVALYVDVYSADGTTVIAFDHAGTVAPVARFSALGTGTLYVRIRALRGNDTGAYDFKLSDLGLDDYPDTPALASPLMVGSAWNGTLEFSSDVDVVKLSLLGGRKYGIGQFAEDAGVVPSAFTLELLAADAVTVVRKEVSVIKTVRPDAGEFFVRVSGGTGAYNYTVLDFGPDDHGEARVEATVVVPSANYFYGMLERGDDLDFFAFDGQAGHFYRTECSMTSPISGYIGLFANDPGGFTPYATYFYGDQAFTAYEASTTGRYSFQVQGSAPAQYRCRLRDLGLDDHGNNTNQASSLAVGVPATGEIQAADDRDLFRLPTTAGHIYRATCASSVTDWCVVHLIDSSGTVLESTSGSSPMTWESTGADSFLRVSGNGVYTYEYTLLVEDLGLDDHGDTIATASSIVPGPMLVSGSSELSSDVDVFSFTATSPNIYRFTCSLPGGIACTLKLKDAAGVVLQQRPAGQFPLVPLAIEATAAATYFVEVSAGSSTTYQWQLENLGPDDFGDDAASASPIAAGAVITGALETPTDVDVFTFSAVAGRAYRFTCTSPEQFYKPGLQIKTLAGTVIDSATPCTAGFKPTSSGTFLVEVVSYTYWVNPTYVLSMEDLGPEDHGDTLAAATALAVPTSPTPAELEFESDIDFFSFDTVAGHVYRFDISPDVPGLNHLLRDALGTEIPGTTKASSRAKSEVTGKMYCEVSTTLANAAYTYAVVDLGPEDHGDVPSSATPIALNVAIAGTIDTATDVDFFSISLPAATTLTLSPNSGIQLLVTDAAGLPLTIESESPQPYVTTAAGSYRVRARAAYGVYPVAYTLLAH